jgi:hypothetical protein
MNRSQEISEVVATMERDGKPVEVCATATAQFDRDAGRLEVTLDAFVRPVDLLHAETHERPAWLPARETVREGVAWEEASALTRDIFQRWVRKVRQAIPASLES